MKRYMSKRFYVTIDCDKALWSRPEAKRHRDRNSYDIPTVSALKEIVACVYKKPCFTIVIDKIAVLKLGGRHSQTGHKTEELTKTNKEFNNTRFIAGETFILDSKYYVEFHIEPNFKFSPDENYSGNTEDIYNISTGHFDKFFNKHEAIFDRRFGRSELFKSAFGGVTNAGILNIEQCEKINRIDWLPNLIIEPTFMCFLFGNESNYKKEPENKYAWRLGGNQKVKLIWSNPEFDSDGFLTPPHPEDLYEDQVISNPISSGFVHSSFKIKNI